MRTREFRKKPTDRLSDTDLSNDGRRCHHAAIQQMKRDSKPGLPQMAGRTSRAAAANGGEENE